MRSELAEDRDDDEEMNQLYGDQPVGRSWVPGGPNSDVGRGTVGSASLDLSPFQYSERSSVAPGLFPGQVLTEECPPRAKSERASHARSHLNAR